MFRTLSIAAVVALAAATGAVVAAKGSSPIEMAKLVFERADADGNGFLSREEHRAAGLARYGVSFRDFDLNLDSRVTLSEYLAAFRRYHGGPEERMA